jgi:hypothetical protein
VKGNRAFNRKRVSGSPEVGVTVTVSTTNGTVLMPDVWVAGPSDVNLISTLAVASYGDSDPVTLKNTS